MGRMIDADALKELFPDDGEGSWTYNVTVKAYIDAQPTIEPERKTGRWIPCSERLPEEDDYKPFSYYEDGAILFCTKNGKVGFGWYYESTKEWANEDDHTPGEVIAWMPLPEPYKEGAQE